MPRMEELVKNMSETKRRSRQNAPEEPGETQARTNAKKITRREQEAKAHRRWIALVGIGTFCSTMVITYLSDTVLSNANLLISFVILIAIIALGIATDIVGIAVASVSLEPFNAMAARKRRGAKTAVWLVKNAAKVSSVCNDVIGDICGVVSGGISVSITAQLARFYGLADSSLAGLIIAASVACLTVGGKAIGKDVAMKNGTAIVSVIAGPIAAVQNLVNRKN